MFKRYGGNCEQIERVSASCVIAYGVMPTPRGARSCRLCLAVGDRREARLLTADMIDMRATLAAQRWLSANAAGWMVGADD